MPPSNTSFIPEKVKGLGTQKGRFFETKIKKVKKMGWSKSFVDGGWDGSQMFDRFWQVVCFLAFTFFDIAWISIDENLKNVLAQSIEKNPSIEKPSTEKKKKKKKKEKENHEINQKIFKKKASIFCSNLSHSKGRKERKKNFFSFSNFKSHRFISRSPMISKWFSSHSHLLSPSS